jgi:putative flippase GtrA
MATIIEPIRSKDTLRSLGRFLAVGALGTLIDFSLFTGLHVALGAPILLANVLSYSAGILNNFFLHRYWTFAERPRKGLTSQFSQFLVVSLAALALNTLLVGLLAGPLSALLSSAPAGALAAKACATAVGLAWNFAANQLWTFRPGGKENQPSARRG